MGKPWNRNKKPVIKRPKGFCDFDGCTTRAKARHECMTCVRKNVDPPVSVAGCSVHADWALNALKTHCLTKHSGVLVSAVGAALVGDDVW